MRKAIAMGHTLGSQGKRGSGGTSKRFPRPADQEYGTTAWTVTARVRHRCDEYASDCWIRTGERYARFVAFPGTDMVDKTVWTPFGVVPGRPRVMRMCERHATQYGRTMPATQAERRAGGAK